MSKEWFYKQSLKAQAKVKNKNNINVYYKSNENYKEEIDMKNNKNILTVAIDAGKGYTKWAYEVEVMARKKVGEEIVEVPKKVWKTGIEESTVVKGEADFGNTIYITTEGEEVAYNFNGKNKVVENKDKTKNNDEHKALMQRALYKIALEEKITDFDVIMCISLDQFKSPENVDKMQKNMFVKEFKIKEEEKEVTINIHNLVIEPETLVSTRFAKTPIKDNNIVLCDIGTLNVGIIPLAKGKLMRDEITAPRVGYDYMISAFKEYSDTAGLDYKKEILEIYVDEHQGTGHKLDEVFSKFFKEEYAPMLKKEIDSKGFGEFSKIVFLGGTSSKCKALLEENFTEYLGIEVITDIFATVKGAYRKGTKNLEKIKEAVLA